MDSQFIGGNDGLNSALRPTSGFSIARLSGACPSSRLVFLSTGSAAGLSPALQSLPALPLKSLPFDLAAVVRERRAKARRSRRSCRELQGGDLRRPRSLNKLTHPTSRPPKWPPYNFQNSPFIISQLH
jgi:hypothetical protein